MACSFLFREGVSILRSLLREKEECNQEFSHVVANVYPGLYILLSWNSEVMVLCMQCLPLIIVNLHCMQWRLRLTLYASGSHWYVFFPGFLDGSWGGRKFMVTLRQLRTKGGEPVASCLHKLHFTVTVWQHTCGVVRRSVSQSRFIAVFFVVFGFTIGFDGVGSNGTMFCLFGLVGCVVLQHLM